MSRTARIAMGTLIAVVGLGGVVALGPAVSAPAVASEPSGQSHQVVDTMMDAMHGAGTPDRMHQMWSVEEMMEQCAAMMSGMGGMMGG